MLLILDLDETLIFGSRESLSRPEDFRCGPYAVYKRPHLRRFLDFACSSFSVAVWTSSSESYARCVCSNVFPSGYQLEFVWSHSRCTQRFNELTQSYDNLKDLRKVKKRGFPLEQVLVVDNTPRKLSRSYGNLVTVQPFHGDESDEELAFLERYLEESENVRNVRAVEKRGWRRRFE